MIDDIAPLSFVERVARLEERMTSVLGLLDEIRRDQKILADAMARASGGLRVLLLLGGVVGIISALRQLAVWAGGLLPHIPGSST